LPKEKFKKNFKKETEKYRITYSTISNFKDQPLKPLELQLTRSLSLQTIILEIRTTFIPKLKLMKFHQNRNKAALRNRKTIKIVQISANPFT